MNIGLIVNPIAGMGGRVGLKGTDTPEILKEAIRLDAVPLCIERTKECFLELKDDLEGTQVLTCGGEMGEEILSDLGIDRWVVHNIDADLFTKTSPADTIRAAEIMRDKGVDLLVFAGGDGTARDISGVIGQDVPMLGIPTGVKMHSSVFGTNPVNTAEIIRKFLQGEVELGEGEVMDIDEDSYRQGKLDVKLYGVAKVPIAREFMQASKQVFHQGSQEALLEEIGDFFKEIADENPDTLFFLGAGSTVGRVKKWLGITDATLLGIDGYFRGESVGSDLNERGILELMDKYSDKAAICVSPIGAQGFVLGRGSQQFSPEVLRRVGVDNVYIVATPDKIDSIDGLRVDTGDKDIDSEMAGFRRVITGYRIQSMVKLL